MSYFSKFSLASTAAAATLLAAAPLASAAPSGAWTQVNTNFTVSGQTAKVTMSSHGMQHLVMVEGQSTNKWGSPSSAGYQVDYGDGSAQDRTNAMGDTSCTTGTKLAPFADKPLTFTHSYAKPGTYIVTVYGYYCGDLGETNRVSRMEVTVGAKHHGNATSPTSVQHPAAQVPGRVKMPQGQGQPKAVAPATGPKVNTDMVTARSDENATGDLALGALAVSAVGAGVAIRRRVTQR